MPKPGPKRKKPVRVIGRISAENEVRPLPVIRTLRWYEKGAAVILYNWFRREHMNFLSGYKTYLAAVGFIGFGIHLWINTGDFNSGVQAALQGLAVLGIGHKLAKAGGA